MWEYRLYFLYFVQIHLLWEYYSGHSLPSTPKSWYSNVCGCPFYLPLTMKLTFPLHEGCRHSGQCRERRYESWYFYRKSQPISDPWEDPVTAVFSRQQWGRAVAWNPGWQEDCIKCHKRHVSPSACLIKSLKRQVNMEQPINSERVGLLSCFSWTSMVNRTQIRVFQKHHLWSDCTANCDSRIKFDGKKKKNRQIIPRKKKDVKNQKTTLPQWWLCSLKQRFISIFSAAWSAEIKILLFFNANEHILIVVQKWKI